MSWSSGTSQTIPTWTGFEVGGIPFPIALFLIPHSPSPIPRSPTPSVPFILIRIRIRICICILVAVVGGALLMDPFVFGI